MLSDSQQSAGEIVYASANEPTARDGQGESSTMMQEVTISGTTCMFKSLMKIFIILLYKEYFEKHSCGKNHYLSGEIGCGPILFEGTDY